MEEEEVTERRTPRGSEGASRKKQNIEDYYRMGGACQTSYYNTLFLFGDYIYICAVNTIISSSVSV